MYLLLGVTLWACVYASGFHASLAGIVLALLIPTRPPANLRALIWVIDDMGVRPASKQHKNPIPYVGTKDFRGLAESQLIGFDRHRA